MSIESVMPSNRLSPPSPPALNPSQPQGLFNEPALRLSWFKRLQASWERVMSPSRPPRLPWPLRARFLQGGGGVGASGWQPPLRITAPGPQVWFFRRCGDRSPGTAPGTGRGGGGAVAGHSHAQSVVRQGPWPAGHIRA